MPQQTVELAYDEDTGELIEATELLVMPEADHVLLRRDVAARLSVYRKAQRNGAPLPTPRLRCTLCNTPLGLSRWATEERNRWFRHVGGDVPCPWRERDKVFDPMALRYHGQQEGRPHILLKQFIARWLAREPGVSQIQNERTVFSGRD